MSNKIIKIGGQTLEMREYETTASERSTYGLNVYVAWDVKCALWCIACYIQKRWCNIIL